jgi:hypothetical protein
MAKVDAENLVSISVPTKVLIPLVLAVFASIGSPWAVRFFAQPGVDAVSAASKDGSGLPELRQEVAGLREAGDWRGKQIDLLVAEQKETNRILNQIEGKLSIINPYGWPNGRPPVGGIP